MLILIVEPVNYLQNTFSKMSEGRKRNSTNTMKLGSSRSGGKNRSEFKWKSMKGC